ncbi:MAG: hypothetical protein ACYS7Y_24870 [Planctomycetota bacterium]|jgi:hypothetical protein
MKKIVMTISTCADCPHEMLAVAAGSVGYCAKTGERMDTNTLPEWCPLPDAEDS